MLQQIYDKLGPEICSALPGFHSIKGTDITGRISSKTVPSMSPATLRWKCFQKLTSSQNVHILPPTTGTWLQHIYSAHLQAYIRAHDKVLHPSVPDPCELGWVKQDGRYRPILSVDPVAPEAVVELLKCNCGVSFCSRRCTCVNMKQVNIVWIHTPMSRNRMKVLENKSRH